MNRRAGYEIVDLFERALADYCGAPLAVATDSCTNAIFLSLWWIRRQHTDLDVHLPALRLPKHTYVGVYHAAVNAGFTVTWTDEEWSGGYRIRPTFVYDSAKRLSRGMYEADGDGSLTCLSFHWSKLLPIGRGGAILLDDHAANDWLRSARIDGRREGETYSRPVFQRNGWHMNMHGDDAARGLHMLTYIDDDDPNDWTAYPDLSVAEWS